FRLVLTGRAPQLIRFYPCLGGTAPASQAWPMMRGDRRAHRENACCPRGPAADQRGRSIGCVVAGLFDLVAASGVRRIRPLELGASAGLNLLLDYYAFRGTSWHFGSIDSKVQFVEPIEGPVQPERFMITDERAAIFIRWTPRRPRAGCC
ncbi:MAG TPA: DUF2332 family protein, partial [Propionibacteriaceae bacterium]|nr:DUF2332 family protein [Propionibacteriaceae bacterium]